MNSRSAATGGPLRDSFRSDCLLVHYNEIALKRKNRGFFEHALMDALEVALRDLGLRRVRRQHGRLLVEFREALALGALERLRSIPGISNFELARRTELDLDAVEAAIAEGIEEVEVDTFAIHTRRANKAFPLNSVEVNRRVGQFVVDRKGWKVDIDHATLPIYLYLLDDCAFVAFDRVPGAGGMPRGVAGKVACLISGGIDSPVAAYRMIRRGCEPIFVHFHSAPFTDAASQEKVVELASHLLRYQKPAKLYLVPFGALQRRIVAETRPRLRVILYRRFMVCAAEAIARKEGALALITGEALGQVASQTLENLATIEAATTLPILRPLIGLDKLEIIREAERIGTFETSIEPHDDCCSFLMPSHPATYSNPAELDEAERIFDIAAEVASLLEQAEVVGVGGEGAEKLTRAQG